ncbi:PAS domain S-box protein [Fulvivirgaceae bacterium BMA10]|uniref:histidine kinase n=1 Tax=Splendidivirga corallicola TaxID=3051826 RepID=A0ABT8KH04_9BACT|nr:PAS domain S-box protein [Fulvivirgaceae bacterium BMA10]
MDFHSKTKEQLAAEIKNLQKKLEIAERRFSKLFESSHDSILILENGRIIDCNYRAIKTFKRSRTRLIYKSIADLSPTSQPDGSISSEKIDIFIESALRGEKQIFDWQFERSPNDIFYSRIILDLNIVAEKSFLFVQIRDLTRRKIALKSFREGESKFRTLADNAPVLLKMTTPNNYFYYFSKQWLEFTGKTEKQEQNNGWIDNIYKEDVDRVLSEIDLAFKKRQKYDVTYRLKRNDGVHRWVQDMGIPHQDEEGKFTGYISATIDISDRRLLEEEENRKAALAESEKRLHQSLRKANILAITVNNKGTITFCNNSICKLIDSDNDDIIGKDIFDLVILGETKSSEKINFENIIENGGFPSDVETFLKSANGELIDVLFNSIILNNEKGQISGITFIGEDISEQNKVKKALDRTNAQLKDLFDNSNDLIQVFTLKGDFLLVNKAWTEKLGYADSELASIKLQDIIHPSHKENTLESLKLIAKGHNIEKIETVFLSKEGRGIFLSGSVNASKERGDATELRGIFHDITERVRAEKAQSLYYSIANLTVQSINLNDLYSNIHKELSKVIPVDNFYISLYKKGEKTIHFPYFIDEHFGPSTKPMERPVGKGLPEYAIDQGKPLFLREKDIEQLIDERKLNIDMILPKVWLGVPLTLENKTLGIISILSYDHKNSYTFRDLELLDFISGQIALAIERKQNEEKINKQTARLRAIFESSTHLIWSVNRSYEFTSFNQNFSDAIYGQYGTRPALINDKYQIENADYHGYWHDIYRKAFEGNSLEFETKFKDISGKELWKTIFINPIYSEDGSIEELSGIANDITEKKQSEIALQRSEKKFRDIFESFQDIYFRCRLNGTITMISPSVNELIGYNQKDVLNKNITDYYLYNTKTKDLIRKLVKRKSVRNFEASIIDKKGNILQCICNVRLLSNDQDQPVEIEGVARDITNLKKANEELLNAKDIAEHSLKVKEIFLANMSHEIRTPMNGIIGMIDLLGSTNLENEQKEYIQTIKKSSETLLNILNSILDLSKIEAGKMQLNPVTVSVKDLMDKLYALFSQQALSKNINLFYHIGEDIPKYISVDEIRLLQILSNLTSNAIKFTKGGGSININLKSTRTAANKYLLKAEVRDSGIGISKDNMDRLFNNFSQLDNSSTKEYEGTGLGLAISKELAALMGGEIGVYSSPGFGSTFWFTFEVEKGNEKSYKKTNKHKKDPGLTQPFSDTKPNLLIVDDNQVNRQVASQILRKSGCNVDTAHSGREALKLVQKKEYDIIFMDIQMPGMDGITVTKRIKRLKLDSLPPIIAMTAYSMQEDREKFLKAGLDDYISKPLKANALISKVQDWVLNKDESSGLLGSNFREGQETIQESIIDMIIDEEIIDQLSKYGGEETLIKIYEDFEQETAEEVENLDEHLKNKHYKDILSILHTIKGNAGTLGIGKVAKCAELIESRLKNQNYGTLEQDFGTIKMMFSEFRINYRDILKKQLKCQEQEKY